MLDIGWTELLVIGALALIVVGPRDLPQLLRTVGQTVGKIKRMAREFQRSVEDAARETDVANFKELRDIKKEMGSFDFRQQADKAQSFMNKPAGDAAKGAGARGGANEAPAGTAKASATPAELPEPASGPETPAGPAAAAPPAPARGAAPDIAADTSADPGPRGPGGDPVADPKARQAAKG